MAALQVLTARPKRAVRLTRNSKLFKTIISAIRRKKGEHIVSLDLRKIPEAVADFFIVCEATSHIQVKAIADEIEREIKEQTGELPFHHEGFQALQWVLIDYVNVVVHIFQPETRRFYRLEEMWNDAGYLEHQ
ncbi:MAG: ribosome silencing factor [Chitinophagaceae bacterium]|nr:ribosome silencing factor [Chitinophagaceae bacterium]